MKLQGLSLQGKGMVTAFYRKVKAEPCNPGRSCHAR